MQASNFTWLGTTGDGGKGGGGAQKNVARASKSSALAGFTAWFWGGLRF